MLLRYLIIYACLLSLYNETIAQYQGLKTQVTQNGNYYFINESDNINQPSVDLLLHFNTDEQQYAKYKISQIKAHLLTQQFAKKVSVAQSNYFYKLSAQFNPVFQDSLIHYLNYSLYPNGNFTDSINYPVIIDSLIPAMYSSFQKTTNIPNGIYYPLKYNIIVNTPKGSGNIASYLNPIVNTFPDYNEYKLHTYNKQNRQQNNQINHLKNTPNALTTVYFGPHAENIIKYHVVVLLLQHAYQQNNTTQQLTISYNGNYSFLQLKSNTKTDSLIKQYIANSNPLSSATFTLNPYNFKQAKLQTINRINNLTNAQKLYFGNIDKQAFINVAKQLTLAETEQITQQFTVGSKFYGLLRSKDKKININQQLTQQSIYFLKHTSKFKHAQDTLTLNALVSYLNLNPQINLTISGFANKNELFKKNNQTLYKYYLSLKNTQNSTQNNYNYYRKNKPFKLGFLRALIVHQYLINHGINAKRLAVSGNIIKSKDTKPTVKFIVND